MYSFKTFKILLASIICTLLTANTATAQEDSRVEFSGFARVVAGYLNDSDASYNGYDNSPDILNESLLGLRADIHATDSLTIQYG
jgi:hypothetical protein